MPGVIKVGFTTSPIQDRLRQLNTTGVPSPFEVAAMFRVDNPQACEKAIHRRLARYRVTSEREFFKIDLKVLLEKSCQIIFSHLSSNSASNSTERNKQPDHGLDDAQVFALQLLAHDARLSGMTVCALVTNGHWADNLTLEYKLASLRERGLVEELKRGKENLSCWRVTSNGIKFMFENGLILEDLLKEGL